MTGPYIVTTRSPGDQDRCRLCGSKWGGCGCVMGWSPPRRLVVATLREARTKAREAGLVAVPEWGCGDTLPDGTVIEVERKLWINVAIEAGIANAGQLAAYAESDPSGPSARKIVATWNTRPPVAAPESPSVDVEWLR